MTLCAMLRTLKRPWLALLLLALVLLGGVVHGFLGDRPPENLAQVWRS
jgi:hypothetical protein